MRWNDTNRQSRRGATVGWVSVLGLTLLLGLGGCTDSYTEVDPDFQLGDLVPEFDPPALEEIDSEVAAAGGWVDQPVRDGLTLLRDHLADEPQLVPVAEALRMRNDSPEDNEAILSALGRLPESDDDVDWDGEWVRHTPQDIKSTNPIMANSVAEFSVSTYTSFGLFSFDWNMDPFATADTVVSWQSSPDRMYDKVVMRDDMTWSDGTPITAHDVEFSFKLIMSEAVPVPAVRSGTDELKYVKAYDDHTLVYFHKEPMATNVWNVNFPVVPKHIYEETAPRDPTLQDSDRHVELEDSPISGGPYKMVKRTRGGEIVLERREDWWRYDGEPVRRRPYFKTIRMRYTPEISVALMQLKAGDLDEMELRPDDWLTQTNGDDFYQHNTKVYGTEWVYFYFVWNTESPLFEDKRVRTAMSYAMDYDELFGAVLHNLYDPSVGIFHPESKWAPDDPPKPYEQNYDKAKALLQEAGWIDHDRDGILDKEIGGQRVPFEFTVICPSIKSRIQICELLKESLDRIGIRCNVSPLETTVLQERLFERRYQAAFSGWGTGADPDTSQNIWGTGEGRNYAQYSNPEVDKLFEMAKRELDEEKRREMYAKIHMILWEDQPYTWLYTRNSYYAFSKELRGYKFSPRGPYHYSPGASSIWQARDEQ